MTRRDEYEIHEQRVIAALSASYKDPPKNCWMCLFSRNEVRNEGYTVCYFRPVPVERNGAGCPPEFFLKHLLEKI